MNTKADKNENGQGGGNPVMQLISTWGLQKPVIAVQDGVNSVVDVLNSFLPDPKEVCINLHAYCRTRNKTVNLFVNSLLYFSI